MSLSPLKIGIAGGSLGGLFAAVLLDAAGHDVTVYERSHRGLEGRGAGLVAQRETFRILRAIGCEHVARIGVVAKERIFLDRAGRIVERHATPQTQISWDVLFRTVRDHLPPQRYLLGREAVSATDSGDAAILTFADGTQAPFDLILGADGLGSAVRPFVTGSHEGPIYAGYAAWRVLVPETDLPAASDILLDRFTFFQTPGLQVLGYLVPGPDGSMEPGRRRYNCVWYRRVSETDGALAEALTDAEGRRHRFSLSPGSMSESARAKLLNDAERLLPAPLSAVWTVATEPFIQAIFDYEAPAMARGRVALAGDAAFVVRPHTAMGVSKAAGDAMALVQSLAQTESLAAALAAYAAERSAVGGEIAAYGRHLGGSLRL